MVCNKTYADGQIIGVQITLKCYITHTMYREQNIEFWVWILKKKNVFGPIHAVSISCSFSMPNESIGRSSTLKKKYSFIFVMQFLKVHFQIQFSKKKKKKKKGK